MVRKRPLSEEEKKLWKHITRNDKPFRSDTKAQETEEAQPIKVSQPKTVIKSPKPKPVIAAAPKPVKDKPVAQGDYAGIDRNTAERFRKGDSPIDARLDLHGMTRENAHRALVVFIRQQVKLESRRLLVITGKGSGILRESLPAWLDSPSLSGAILAFDVAKPKHGGTGAFYILLKRKRINK